jgi:glycine betaine catabolism A
LRPTHRTLTGHAYRSDEVFELERERIFHRGWFYVGREERIASPGDRLPVDVAGESLLLVRGGDGLRAFRNVCRHRGARLCDPGEEERARVITCPYHGWSYSLSGELIGTPHIPRDELDRSQLSLWPAEVDVWEGLVFVRVEPGSPTMREWLADGERDLERFEVFGLADRRTVHTTVTEVDANWKVLVENYCECLHCSRVHPELVDLIPAYRSGSTVDPERDDYGVGLARDSEAYVRAGYADLAAAAGLEDDEAANSYYGAVLFPNAFLDVTGSSVVVSKLLPTGPHTTTVIGEYLFTPEVLDAPGFDPTPVIEFNELVAHQDFDVCERVQRGVASPAFDFGVYAEHDVYARQFAERYVTEMGDVPGLRG